MMFMGPNVLRRNAKKSAPQPITWCHNPYAEMLLKVRTQGKGQVNIAEMPTLLHPSRSTTGGQRKHAEMPQVARPHQFYLVPSKRCRNAVENSRQGKGHFMSAEMLSPSRPSQPITGGHRQLAEMPLYLRPHRIWASVVPQQCQKVGAQITTTRGQSKSSK